MFKALKRLTCPVDDLNAAFRWYREILGREPVFVSPLVVQFAVGGAELVLVPAPGAPRQPAAHPLGWWEVDDVDASHDAIVAAGGKSLAEPRTVMLSRQARVADPFGNSFGLTGSLDANRRRTLVELPSDSALAIALSRALAARDPRTEIRGRDTLADVFLPPDTVAGLANPAGAAWLRGFMARGGAYEFFLARTAWLDAMMDAALRDGIPQIVLLGAGYDTRAIRFAGANRETRVFELDIAPTQARKQRCLANAKVDVPPALVFAPIDFTRESIAEVLARASYDRTRRTLFIWEGVTYYLPGEAVDRTLQFIRQNAPAGSTVAFDYMLDGPGVTERHGAKLALESMKIHYPSEPVHWRLPESEIAAFLSARGFRLEEQMDARAMEQRFLTLKDGTVAAPALALFNLVQAVVA